MVDGGRHSCPSALYNSGGRYLLDNLKRSKTVSKFKKFISMILGVVLCFTMAISVVGCGNTNNDDETVTVTDMLGEQVTVKKNPKKVACASRTTYDLLIAFGVADSIDGVYYSLLNNEWSSVFDAKVIYSSHTGSSPFSAL